MRRIPSWALTLTKAAIAGGLIWWLLQRGILNFDAIRGALERWPLLLLILGIVYAQVGLTAWRWNLLLHSQGVRFRFLDAFSLTMIGMLFNLVMPSSVGGDVMKSWYVHQRAGKRAAEAIATIVLDRIMGLLALLLVAAVAALPSLLMAGSNPQLPRARRVRRCGRVGGGGGAGPGGPVHSPERRLRTPESPACLCREGFRIACRIPRTPGVLIAALALSAANFTLACAAFYCSALAIGVPPFPLRFLFLVPLGIATTALPISPAGIGVGQVAFAELFRLSSDGLYTFGANAFTIMQTTQFLVSLTGFFAYLAYRQPPDGQTGIPPK